MPILTRYCNVLRCLRIAASETARRIFRTQANLSRELKLEVKGVERKAIRSIYEEDLDAKIIARKTALSTFTAMYQTGT